jgi:hypothetical protein
LAHDDAAEAERGCCKRLRIGQNPQSQAIDGGVDKSYGVARRLAGGSVDGFECSEAADETVKRQAHPVERAGSILFSF